MKKKYYVVTFYNSKTVFSCAFNSSEAIILSQAVMIKNGLAYDVESMRETHYESDKQLTDFYA